MEMRTQGISVHPEVIKRADLAKVLPDSTFKALKKSSRIDCEKDSYSETRDVVTTIVHNHMSAATPLDVNNHTKHREGEVT